MITLKSITLFFGISFILLTVFYSPKYGQSNAVISKKVALYWFDPITNAFLIYDVSSFCDNSNSYPCALGYLHVSDPSNPQKPNTTPDAIETGGEP